MIEVSTQNICPPIPVRRFDWQASLPDREAESPLGHGATEREALADLLGNFDEAPEVIAVVDKIIRHYAQTIWSGRSNEHHDAKTIGGIQIGMDRVLKLLGDLA